MAAIKRGFFIKSFRLKEFVSHSSIISDLFLKFLNFSGYFCNTGFPEVKPVEKEFKYRNKDQ